MKITIEPTPDFASVQGVRCRLWKGRTESGGECVVFVPLLTTERGAAPDLEAELHELPASIKRVAPYRLGSGWT